MRVMIVTEEDEFYIPLSIQFILSHCKDDIVEVVCLKNPLIKSPIHAARIFYRAFRMRPLLRHAMRLSIAKMYNRFPFLNRTNRYFSVRRVCEAYGVTYNYVEKANSKAFRKHCQALGLDLIACVSPTQVFKKRLLSIPKYGCINIHTAKLPAYRGLYPTYWAMAKGEKKLNISVHFMNEGIDTGDIILQEEVDIPPKATLHHMLTQTKLMGAKMLVKAIGLVDSGKYAPIQTDKDKGSYYSFPDRQSYKDFLKNGYRIY